MLTSAAQLATRRAQANSSPPFGFESYHAAASMKARRRSAERYGGIVASTMESSGCHGLLMNVAHCVTSSVAPSAFAGFRFPTEVITVAVSP